MTDERWACSKRGKEKKILKKKARLCGGTGSFAHQGLSSLSSIASNWSVKLASMCSMS